MTNSIFVFGTYALKLYLFHIQRPIISTNFNIYVHNDEELIELIHNGCPYSRYFSPQSFKLLYAKCS